MNLSLAYLGHILNGIILLMMIHTTGTVILSIKLEIMMQKCYSCVV